jgi:hypothetical protein
MENKLFISYRHENDEHRRSVRRLGELLRQAKIDVTLDQFFLEDHPGGPDQGWPKWSEDRANLSQCVLIIGSEGWFGAWNGKEPPGLGLGAATEADIIRQYLFDTKGDNSRVRLAFLNHVDESSIPPRLKGWHRFQPFLQDHELDQLIRWVAERLSLQNVESPSAQWPHAVPFQPDLANRSKKEWPAIVDLLAGRSRERILIFEGGIGMGKSELLRQAAVYARKLGICVAPLDFKQGGYPDVESILGQIGVEIGAHLPNFMGDGSNKTHLLRNDLRAARRPILLTFDTYEDVADDKPVASWLVQQLLREVETALSLCIILSGRRVPEIQGVPWKAVARRLSLGAITEPEPWEEWVAWRYPDFQHKHALRSLVLGVQGSPLEIKKICDNLARVE